MTPRDWVRVAAIGLVGVGLLCLPSAGRSARSYGTGFSILSDTGSLMWLAGILIIGGVILLLFHSPSKGALDDITPTI